MPSTDTIRMLQLGCQAADAAEWRRKQARVAWVRRTVAALREAQRECDAAWEALVRDVPEERIDDVEILPPPEQAKVDALLGQIKAVIDRDEWPRELYWSL